VASIVANARALLMPSFAEGYGFPIVEALAAGTRVVASDIPVFKEVADKNVTYCDLNDDAAWLDAINLHMSFSAKSRAGLLETLLQSWELYYRNLDTYLEGI
jgi:glycosyltransferase involved in cell wall biosynthesis